LCAIPPEGLPRFCFFNEHHVKDFRLCGESGQKKKATEGSPSLIEEEFVFENDQFPLNNKLVLNFTLPDT